MSGFHFCLNLRKINTYAKKYLEVASGFLTNSKNKEVLIHPRVLVADISHGLLSPVLKVIILGSHCLVSERHRTTMK